MRHQHFLTMALCLLMAFPFRAQARQNASRTLRFSGYEWEVREAGTGGPGPCHWDPNSVRVDGNGWLRLKIAFVQGEWRCAELSTKKRFGFGRYQFQVAGDLNALDRNVVLGLFNYPSPDVGKDGTNEIDIEFARWGDKSALAGNYTVYPASGARSPTDHQTFPMSLAGNLTTHRFVWTPAQVAYTSLRDPRDDDAQLITRWQYAPNNPRLIPQKPLPIHLNLWLFQGKPPTDRKPVEIVIRQFTFIPLDLLPAS